MADDRKQDRPRTPDGTPQPPTKPGDRRSARGGDLSLERDPGDAVPAGVAPQPPAPAPSEEDLRVREALERKLGGQSRKDQGGSRGA
jgi:hypothetical protein